MANTSQGDDSRANAGLSSTDGPGDGEGFDPCTGSEVIMGLSDDHEFREWMPIRI
jgi:hypothetical protein